MSSNNCARADQAKTDWNFSFGHCLYRERVTKQRIDLKDIEADCRGGSARRSIASADGKAADEHKDEGIDPADCKVSFSQGTVDFDYFEGKFLGKPALVMKSGNCRWFYWGDSPSSSPLSHVDRTESVGRLRCAFFSESKPRPHWMTLDMTCIGTAATRTVRWKASSGVRVRSGWSRWTKPCPLPNSPLLWMA